MEKYRSSGPGFRLSTCENSPVIYLNGGNDLQMILDRIETAGGKIVSSKNMVTDEIGYVAFFLDCEGNKIGLWSRN